MPPNLSLIQSRSLRPRRPSMDQRTWFSTDQRACARAKSLSTSTIPLVSSSLLSPLSSLSPYLSMCVNICTLPGNDPRQPLHQHFLLLTFSVVTWTGRIYPHRQPHPGEPHPHLPPIYASTDTHLHQHRYPSLAPVPILLRTFLCAGGSLTPARCLWLISYFCSLSSPFLYGYVSSVL